MTGGLHIPHHPDPYLQCVTVFLQIMVGAWFSLNTATLFFLFNVLFGCFINFGKGGGALNFPINFLYFLIAFVYWLPVCITFFFTRRGLCNLHHAQLPIFCKFSYPEAAIFPSSLFLFLFTPWN